MGAIFIAMEGLDGSGGTTQTRLLADWLRAKGLSEVHTTAEPSTGPVGRFIRTALNPEHEASAIGDAVLPFLFAGDRRDHLDRHDSHRPFASAYPNEQRQRVCFPCCALALFSSLFRRPCV